MQQPHSTTHDAQDHASLRGQFQDLRRPCGDTSFQCTGVSHVDSVVTSITHQPSLVATPFPQQSLLSTAVMSSYPGTSGFSIHQFQLLQQTTSGQGKRDHQSQLPQQITKVQGKRDDFSTFRNSIPQTPQAWLAKRHDFGLTTTDGIRAAFRRLIVSDIPQPYSATSTVRDNVRRYVTSKSRRSACLSTIEDVIFLGECDIALGLGVNLSKVNNAMEKYLSSSTSKDVLRHYRKVPLRSASTDSVFRAEAPSLIPTEVRKKGLQTDLAFYLPFLIWASILLNTKIDCFDELRRRNFPLAGHTSADFRRCLSFLREGRREISLALAQSTHNAQPVEIDAADTNVTRRKRSAGRGPQGREKRARTCHRPPDDPAAPHHTAKEAITEKGASEDDLAGDFDRRHHDAAENFSHGGAQQLAAPHPPSRAAGSGNAVHCDLTSFATGYEPPGCPPLEQFSYPPEVPPELPTQGPPQGYVYVAADIDVPVASCNTGQLDNAPVGLMGSVSSEGAVQAWTPESHWGPCPGGLGCSAAGAGSVGTIIHTGSGQIDALAHLVPKRQTPCFPSRRVLVVSGCKFDGGLKTADGNENVCAARPTCDSVAGLELDRSSPRSYVATSE
ncbi:hypothetical protein CCHR01_13112 [Colletotrichum chrysophilum]|uniref:Uncharacterized protein n=1 Tax=Colletotrichum chrysophilum TaxID=1836956 RepID=A0AAD9EGT8_9PEZI|nr:hypothetical protein CCHR01_13112 [Colletotrichum chrysophilum]